MSQVAPGPALLSLIHPWIVALPLPTVRRLVAGEDAVAAAPPPPRAGPDVLRIGDGPVAIWDLAALLRLPSPPVRTLAVLDLPGPRMALAIGRCLGVVHLAAVQPLPPAALREPLPLACFAAGPAAERHGAAMVGLWLDPRLLLDPARTRAAEDALAAIPERAA